MTDRDGTAVYVEPVAIEIQFAVAGQHLRSESFVHLDQAELMQPEVMLLFQFAQRRNGSNPHRPWIDSCRGYSRNSRQRLQIVLLYEMFARYNHGSGAVRDSRRIARGDSSSFREHRSELAKL